MATNNDTRLSLRRSRKGSGFTLVETLTATVIMGFLLAGGVDLYVNTLRIASRNNAQVSATDRAAVIAEQVADVARESYGFALPTDASGFVPPNAGYTAANYVTSDGSAAALQLTAPATTSITVVNSAGTACTTGTNFPAVYTHAAGTVLTLYRADANGNPAPDTGQYLWESGTPPGGSALPAGMKLRLGETTAVSAAIAHAATFVRAPGTTPAVEIQITTGDYSMVGGQQTSPGGTTQTVGKWVLLQNHP